MNSMKIKQSTIEQIDNYVKEGIPPGGFVRAVLENDLMGSCSRADEENAAALHDICSCIYNKVPTACYGSPEKVREWLNSKGGHEKVFDSMLSKIVPGL